jgi:hypothetical protein
MADVDDGSIANEHDLLRRIRPDQVVDDQNLGIRRPSTAAFKDPELSADSEHILTQNGLGWNFCIKGFDGYSLARFSAGSARALNLPVIHKPLPANQAHVEVHGKKTQGVTNSLVGACSWAHLEPKA